MRILIVMALVVSVVPVMGQGTYGGIFFPQGATSFADVVIASDPGNGGPNGCTNTNNNDDPLRVRGIPDGAHHSFGHGGWVKLGFIDNLLTNSGNADDDLHVFEEGPLVESFSIELRPLDAATLAVVSAVLVDADMDGFYDLPNPVAGQPTSIDIDALFPGQPAGALRFDAVEVTDVASHIPTCNATPGCDIDAVGAISADLPTYPGLGEDLLLFSGLNADVLTSGSGNDIKTAMAGDDLVLRIESPLGTFLGDPLVLLGQVYPTAGGIPGGVLPGLWVAPPGPIFILDGSLPGPFGGPSHVLVSGGNVLGFPLPGGFAGLSIVVQAGTVSASAANGFYTLSDAHEIRL